LRAFSTNKLQFKNNERSVRSALAVINQEVRHSRKTVSPYLNTTIGQLENLLKLEHHTGVKTEQMNYENSPVRWI